MDPLMEVTAAGTPSMATAALETNPLPRYPHFVAARPIEGVTLKIRNADVAAGGGGAVGDLSQPPKGTTADAKSPMTAKVYLPCRIRLAEAVP
jgi:hypothetical protein